jgi:hypothetical protein
MELHKIHGVDDAGQPGAPHLHANTWTLQDTTGPDRLVVAARDGFVDLLIALAATLEPPLYALYVLQVPRTEAEAGRYQSDLLEHPQAEAFLTMFGPYLERDARHNLWLGRASGPGMLVYDEHNFIYCYGPLGKFLDVLDERGFTQGEFTLPDPHTHPFHPSFDEDERAITTIDGFWRRGALRPQDER